MRPRGITKVAVGCVAVARFAANHADAADLPAVAALTGAAPGSKLHGEMSLRLRSELELFEDQPDRQRVRVRVRLGGRYELSDRIDVGARLSTGSEDPTSSQLSLGHGFDKQALKVDRAFLRFRPSDGLLLMVGKLPATFHDRRLIWDEDVAPDGLFEEVTWGTTAAPLGGHAAFGQFILEEREDSVRDVFVLVAQVGAAARSGPVTLSIDLTFHDYPNVTAVALEHGHGSNTALPDGRLASDFRLLAGLFEMGLRASAVDLGAYVEMAHNQRAAGGATALAAGVEAEWACPGILFGYEFRRVGRDAILDALAESSWYRERTGFNGHKIGGKLRVSDGLAVGSSFKWMWSLDGPRATHLEWLVDIAWAPP